MPCVTVGHTPTRDAYGYLIPLSLIALSITSYQPSPLSYDIVVEQDSLTSHLATKNSSPFPHSTSDSTTITHRKTHVQSPAQNLLREIKIPSPSRAARTRVDFFSSPHQNQDRDGVKMFPLELTGNITAYWLHPGDGVGYKSAHLLPPQISSSSPHSPQTLSPLLAPLPSPPSPDRLTTRIDFLPHGGGGGSARAHAMKLCMVIFKKWWGWDGQIDIPTSLQSPPLPPQSSLPLGLLPAPPQRGKTGRGKVQTTILGASVSGFGMGIGPGKNGT